MDLGAGFFPCRDYRNLPNPVLNSKGSISEAAQQLQLKDFHGVIEHIWNLRYYRVSESGRYDLVLPEGCGTCSTKHAALVALAHELEESAVQLQLALFIINHKTFPKLRKIFKEHPTKSFLEAHCFIVYKEQYFDFTFKGNSPLHSAQIYGEPIQISVSDIGKNKEQWHRKEMLHWCNENELDFALHWQLREACIQELQVL